MENNNELLDEENNESNNLAIFKLDFYGQKKDKNINFQKWKNSIIKKYNKNVKFFRCVKENIIFCSSNNNNIKKSYTSKCPSCNKDYCNYCSDPSFYNNKCCVKGRINYILFIEGPKLMENHPEDYKEMRLFLLIPFFNILYFIGGVLNCLFLHLKVKNSNILKYEQKIQFFYKYYYYIVLTFGITISIPYVITVFLLTIIIVIISHPVKNCIVKYLLSIMREAIVG